MAPRSRESHILFLLIVGLVGWLVPGGGHAVLREKRHAIVIFVTIVAMFVIGLYIGSIGVINPAGAKPWYLAQVLNSPAVAALGHVATTGDYAVYGKPSEIGQIYTSIAGLLNLLCIVNAVYLAHV
ncbi:MAG: DUF6677 family protein, partial [Planctomycetota bacterium]